MSGRLASSLITPALGSQQRSAATERTAAFSEEQSAVADAGVWCFGARVGAPSAGAARTIRYQARLDGRRSRALKLARQMSVSSARASAAAVVRAGRVTGSRRK